MKEFLNYNYSDFIGYIFDIPINQNLSYSIKTITFQVTDDCNLQCSYCYQINKHHNKMSFETAKTFIDLIFANYQDENFYLYEGNTQGLIIEFIGGEPLLETKLIEDIIDYFEYCFYTKLPLNHPWILWHQYSLCTNGILYFNNEFQNLRKKYNNLFSISITVDGNKKLHDSCRVDKNGKGTYDEAEKAALHNLKFYDSGGTKLTFSPSNIEYMAEAVINMINLGFDHISGNPVYEEGWTWNHGKIAYEQNKILADYIFEHKLNDKVYIRSLDEKNYLFNISKDENWCGSNSCMLAIDYKGDLYPCIRFMESSIGTRIEPYLYGNTYKGFFTNAQEEQRYIDMENLKASNQSTKECLNCTIKSGCGWCTGYNYQHFGTIFHRSTYHCPIHVGWALSTLYFNRLYDKSYNKILVPKHLALNIISEEEYNLLYDIKGGD